MSMMLMVKAMQMKVGNPLRKLVLLKLADNANDKGECWPSYQHIADQCEISRDTAIRHINALAKQGFLKIEKRKVSGTMINHSNIYHLTLGSSTEQPPSSTEQKGSSANRLGSSTEQLGGSSTERPITSHSLEPVNEPVIEPKEAEFNFSQALIDLGANKKRVADLVKARNKKRLVMTESIIDHMQKEASKAGLSIAEVVELCAMKGWGGFEARYYQESNPAKQSSHDLSTQDHSKDENQIPQWMLDLEKEGANQ